MQSHKKPKASFTQWYREHVRSQQPGSHEEQALLLEIDHSGIGRTAGEEAKSRTAYNAIAPHYNKIIDFAPTKLAADYIFSHVRLHGNMSVLSMHSGTAVLETFMAKHKIPHGKVYCLDISDKMNQQGKLLKEKTSARNIEFITGMSNRIPLRGSTQDAIIITGPDIHGAQQAISTIRECRRVIKPKGRFVFLLRILSEKEIPEYINAFRQNGFELMHSQIAVHEMGGVKTGRTLLMVTARPK